MKIYGTLEKSLKFGYDRRSQTGWGRPARTRQFGVWKSKTTVINFGRYHNFHKFLFNLHSFQKHQKVSPSSVELETLQLDSRSENK